MLTPIFIVLAIVAVAAYDLWALLHYGVDGTISRYIRRWNQQWPMVMPIVVFAMGVLVGHFFF